SRERDRLGSSRRAPKTSSGGGRHSSSHRDHRTSTARLRSQFPSIPEQQHTEDRAIIRSFANLITIIDQHTEYYYRRNGPSNQLTTEFNDIRTRHAEIR